MKACFPVIQTLSKIYFLSSKTFMSINSFIKFNFTACLFGKYVLHYFKKYKYKNIAIRILKTMAHSNDIIVTWFNKETSYESEGRI